jgi:hypothetical protein
MMFSTYNRLGVTVFESNLAVIRAFRPKLNRGIDRQRRKELYHAILAEHEKAYNLVREFRL